MVGCLFQNRGSNSVQCQHLDRAKKALNQVTEALNQALKAIITLFTI